MGVKCGRLDEGLCENCKGVNTCDNYVPIFTGIDYRVELLKTIARIYSTYDIKLIRKTKGYRSLEYMMGIYGHHAQFMNDIDSIFYYAATIVLLQQNRFKLFNRLERYKAYEMMRKLDIPLNKRMLKDLKNIKTRG